MLGALIAGMATVVVAVLGLGATRQAARRASDLETLRTVIAELRTELTRESDGRDRERAEHERAADRFRARIRELEAARP